MKQLAKHLYQLRSRDKFQTSLGISRDETSNMMQIRVIDTMVYLEHNVKRDQIALLLLHPYVRSVNVRYGRLFLYKDCLTLFADNNRIVITIEDCYLKQFMEITAQTSRSTGLLYDPSSVRHEVIPKDEELVITDGRITVRLGYKFVWKIHKNSLSEVRKEMAPNWFFGIKRNGEPRFYIEFKDKNSFFFAIPLHFILDQVH